MGRCAIPARRAAPVASEDDFDPFDEARMLGRDGRRAARGQPLRPERPGRRVAVLRGQARLVRAAWRAASRDRAAGGRQLVVGGDFNVAPTDDDVWDAAAVHGGTHVSEPERAAFRALLDLGLTDAYRARHDETGRFTWWDYRAGMFHKNFGMRIDHLLLAAPVAARLVDAEIDRQARKGPPIPSDHAPLLIDLDEPGKPFDPDWTGRWLDRGADRPRAR